ncbi:MAG: SDR family NAD(P)-dependent oxidoreductase, partial [Alphaproteobacteria bacterium]|nr:SDR family NAD(P)-dependent oxidoreductase [Alphaproteobacteria bacterium]
MREFAGRVAVITGAASGFGREFARIAASLGMRVVLADIEPAPLDAVAAELRAGGCEVLAERVDVSRAADVERLASRSVERFGAVHLLFNNAGVAGGGGLIWESTVNGWTWVLGVNLWGVIHGVRCFVPLMLRQGDACHVVNTASAAGLISAQTMGVYNVSKHAVVTLTETLYHDLRLAGGNIGVSLLCPAFVDTGIAEAERNRPAELRDAAPPTPSQRAARAAAAKATASGRLSAAEVARLTFDAIRDHRF